MLGDWLSGRASRLHRGGRRFEPVIAHHFVVFLLISLLAVACGREGHLERPDKSEILNVQRDT